MENIIKKIEEYEIDNNQKWIDLMELHTNKMQIPMANLIGAMKSQLEMIKIELQWKTKK